MHRQCLALLALVAAVAAGGCGKPSLEGTYVSTSELFGVNTESRLVFSRDGSVSLFSGSSTVGTGGRYTIDGDQAHIQFLGGLLVYTAQIGRDEITMDGDTYKRKR
jgi:hypothetical protein